MSNSWKSKSTPEGSQGDDFNVLRRKYTNIIIDIENLHLNANYSISDKISLIIIYV